MIILRAMVTLKDARYAGFEAPFILDDDTSYPCVVGADIEALMKSGETYHVEIKLFWGELSLDLIVCGREVSLGFGVAKITQIVSIRIEKENLQLLRSADETKRLLACAENVPNAVIDEETYKWALKRKRRAVWVKKVVSTSYNMADVIVTDGTHELMCFYYGRSVPPKISAKSQIESITLGFCEDKNDGFPAPISQFYIREERTQSHYGRVVCARVLNKRERLIQIGGIIAEAGAHMRHVVDGEYVELEIGRADINFVDD